MSVPQWQPGTQYPTNSIVTPRSNAIVTQVQPSNNSFESGVTDWTATITSGVGSVVGSTAEAFDGVESALFTASSGTGIRNSAYVTLINTYMAPVTPGQVINFSGYVFRSWTNASTAYVTGGALIYWYNASMNLIGTSIATQPAATLGANQSAPPGMVGTHAFNIWQQTYGQGVAPAGAAYAAAGFNGWVDPNGGSNLYFDDFTWDYTEQGYPPGLVFVAVQPTTGTSGSAEPAWPVMAGSTVVDNTVTWEAEIASEIIWTATSICQSGATQPTWPTTVGGSVVDNTTVWTASDGRITDTNFPQSKAWAIGSAKIFGADNDIIRFCATANPLDWSSSNDAGFIPFGLQTYGNEPCVSLGIYRSNLVAFNSLGYQMWQIDPDPANIAILDAEPVGCNFVKSGQPVNNDYVFLSPVGIRNLGTAGASGNLQAGMFGKQVDPLVQGLMAQAAANGVEIRGMFNPGTGQYFLFFGAECIVLTINGSNTMSWSRYIFPDIITDWTVGNGVLYLRSAGNLVWQLDPTSLVDDQLGANIQFPGYMAWNYLEFGALGVDKMVEGFDLTIGNIDQSGLIQLTNNIKVNVTVGYNQSNTELATAPYTVTGDTIPGTMMPMPIVGPSFQWRLSFPGNQNWGWGALNVYVKPLVKP